MASASTEANQAEVELFEKLDRFVKNNQHKKALKTAEDILAILPKDEDAQLCKIAALMQLGEWETAQTAIQRSPLASKLQFEKAFCLYRLGKNEEALNVLAPILASADHEQVIAALELAAQLHYRQGRSQQCIQLYDKLFQQYKVDSPDLKTNVLAAYVAAGLSREIPTLMAAMKVSADNSFEIGYNKACGLVDAGQWSAAEPELRRALKRGRETLFEEDCTEDEVEEELAPLTVQLAYVLGRQGRQPEAQELYDSVLRRKAELVDETTLAVAINNSFADSGRINALAAHKKTVAGAVKKLESLLENPERGGLLTLTPALEARLSASQKHLLGLNRALAYVLSGRVETARQLAGLLAKQDTQAAAGMPHLLPLLQAALLNKDGKVAEADAVLEQFVKAHPTFALEPTLARTQLALEAGDVSKAVQLLEELTGPGQQPQGALVATQAAFMTQMGDASGAEALLSRTLSALKNTSGPAVSWCLEALVALQLRLGKAQEALSTYTQLQATGTQSATAAALLARLMWVLASASAAGGAPKPLPPALTKGLPSLAAELRSVNVDALENSVASSRASALPTSKADQSAMEIDEEAPAKAVRPKKKSASKKRKRYPKGYDPTLPNGGLPPPDPERWTPKWQRSDAKKKKVKSSARGAVKGSQGAGKVDENLDRTKFEPKVEAKPLSTKPSLPSRKKGGKK